jgi:hypothetical protein
MMGCWRRGFAVMGSAEATGVRRLRPGCGFACIQRSQCARVGASPASAELRKHSSVTPYATSRRLHPPPVRWAFKVCNMTVSTPSSVRQGRARRCG